MKRTAIVFKEMIDVLFIESLPISEFLYVECNEVAYLSTKIYILCASFKHSLVYSHIL